MTIPRKEHGNAVLYQVTQQFHFIININHRHQIEVSSAAQLKEH